MSDISDFGPLRSMKIRLAVLTYNRSEYLRKMLTSLTWQTYVDFSCCVFDNGSTDGTPEVVAEFVSRDTRFESSRVEVTSSICDNFNRAIRWGVAADSFALLHDDDELEPEWLSTLSAALIENPEVGLAASNARHIAGQKLTNVTSFSRLEGVEIFKDHAAFVAWLFRYGALVFPSVLYRSSAVFTEKMPNQGRASDIMFYMRITRNTGAALFYAPLLRYRVHPLQDSAGLSGVDVAQLNQFLQDHLQKYAPTFIGGVRSFTTIHRLVALRARARGKPLSARWRLLLEAFTAGELPWFDMHPRYYPRLLLLLLGR